MQEGGYVLLAGLFNPVKIGAFGPMGEAYDGQIESTDQSIFLFKGEIIDQRGARRDVEMEVTYNRFCHPDWGCGALPIRNEGALIDIAKFQDGTYQVEAGLCSYPVDYAPEFIDIILGVNTMPENMPEAPDGSLGNVFRELLLRFQ